MKTLLNIDFRETQELDDTVFTVQVGDKWANNELQHYVNKPENLFFTDEGLVLRATHPKPGLYESVRMNTKGKFSFQYGEIEIKAKVPSGKGTWPALWMMSEESRYGRWPKSGEIDILEHVGRDENNLFLCLHTETYNHKNNAEFYTEYHLENATTAFHTYGIKWTDDTITYIIDGKEVTTYHKHDKADTSHKGWPFHQPFYLIMNLAIGGKFGGPVDDSIFPKDFVIQTITVKQ
ncbi:MAG: glycoside hydrolase family 16 protein [Candidatus Izimaplasma sp.]|nr:glycoside hydrolase family 16 protein [Candidatus Izimaplasma bacterium]